MPSSVRAPVTDRLVRMFASPFVVLYRAADDHAQRRWPGFRHRNAFEEYALSGLKNRRCVMKPMPDADENRRLGELENDRADRLPAGAARKHHLKKARDHEAS